MTDAELAAFEVDIIAICAEHIQSHWQDVDYRACVSLSLESRKSKYFLKFDDAKTLWPDLLTQSYIYDYAIRHRSGPRIPQENALLILEHIELTHPSLITNLARRTGWAPDCSRGFQLLPKM